MCACVSVHHVSWKFMYSIHRAYILFSSPARSSSCLLKSLSRVFRTQFIRHFLRRVVLMSLNFQDCNNLHMITRVQRLYIPLKTIRPVLELLSDALGRDAKTGRPSVCAPPAEPTVPFPGKVGSPSFSCALGEEGPLPDDGTINSSTRLNSLILSVILPIRH